MKSKSTVSRYFEVLSFVVLVAVFIGTVAFFNAKIDHLINSDAASELILGRLLASENRLLSENWYYSTELRVLNTQIFYSFFFKLTDNWHLVRIASYACMYAMMILVYGALCKALECRRSYWALTAAFLILPFSDEYVLAVLQGAYYIPHISITFTTLAVIEAYMKSTGRKEKIIFAIASILSVVSGMGGPRQVIVLYLPLVLIAFVIAALQMKDASSTAGSGLDIKKLGAATKKYALISTIVCLTEFILLITL